MVEGGTLTDAMGDWSHEIRLDGNDAVHDDEPETVDARASQQFAEAVLTYAFTLPGNGESKQSEAGSGGCRSSGRNGSIASDSDESVRG